MKFRSLAEARSHLGADPDGDDDHQMRERAAHEIATRCAIFKREGWRVRKWSPTKQGPCFDPLLHDFDRLGDGWLDHPFKLLTPAGRTIYVAEPYQISTLGLTNLVKLADQGWDVSIRSDAAIHFPGCTMAVWISRSSGCKDAPGANRAARMGDD